jgi:hypothetical protein
MTMAKLTIKEQALWARDMSVAYLIAADQVDWRNAKTEPKYFLLCHSIELALKGYLLVAIQKMSAEKLVMTSGRRSISP